LAVAYIQRRPVYRPTVNNKINNYNVFRMVEDAKEEGECPGVVMDWGGYGWEGGGAHEAINNDGDTE